MKHTIRDTIIVFFKYSGLALLYRAWMKRGGPLVRVIAFHDVEDASWFENVVQSLVRDMQVITPSDFVKGKFEKTRMNVLVTFDDGYASWVDVCAPILSRYGIKALFFVNSGLLSASKDEEAADSFVRENLRVSAKRTIGEKGISSLLSEGHTIGGHTASHTSLRRAPDATIRHEVESDKAMLENTFGVTLDHFAYPFGTAHDYSNETGATIHTLGYSFVYTAEPGFYKKGALHIPRTLVEKGQPYESIMCWLMGGYDLFSNLKRALNS